MKTEIESNLVLKEWRRELMFWEGFDMAITLVYKTLEVSSIDSREIIKFSEELENEINLYKNDG